MIFMDDHKELVACCIMYDMFSTLNHSDSFMHWGRIGMKWGQHIFGRDNPSAGKRNFEEGWGGVITSSSFYGKMYDNLMDAMDAGDGRERYDPNSPRSQKYMAKGALADDVRRSARGVLQKFMSGRELTAPQSTKDRIENDYADDPEAGKKALRKVDQKHAEQQISELISNYEKANAKVNRYKEMFLKRGTALSEAEHSIMKQMEIVNLGMLAAANSLMDYGKENNLVSHDYTRGWDAEDMLRDRLQEFGNSKSDYVWNYYDK